MDAIVRRPGGRVVAFACAIGVSLLCAGSAHAGVFDSDAFSSDAGGFSSLSADDPPPMTIISGDLTITHVDLGPSPLVATSGTGNLTDIVGGRLVIDTPVGAVAPPGGGNSRLRVAQTFDALGGGAERAWGFLEEEAEQIIASQHQVARGSAEIGDWARGVMRAWMLIRLMDIAKKPASERTWEEQAAVTYLQRKVWERQKRVLNAAIAEHAAWKADPCAYDPPAPFTYGTPLGYCVTNSYQSILIGNPPPPSPSDFVAYGGQIAADEGFDRILKDLAADQGDLPLDLARPVVDTEFRRASKELRAGLDLFRVLGKGLVDGNTDLSGNGESPYDDQTLEAIKTLYDEALVSEASGILFEFALLAAIDQGDIKQLLGAQFVALAKAIWDFVDLETIDDKLEGSLADVSRRAPDLGALLDTSSGRELIIAIFMEETLHDHLYERKESLRTPPPHATTDLNWERTTRADAAWDSPQELEALPLTDWRKPLAQLPDPPGNPGSAEILASPRGHWFLLTDPSGGTINAPGYGRITVNAPEKALSLGYTDWAGDYWTAWWLGTTFIHIKEGTPLSGQAEVVESLERRCPPTRLTPDDELTGPDCVEGTGTAFTSQLQQGDNVLLAGEYRTVSRVVNDQYVQVTKPFAATTHVAGPIVKLAGTRATCWQTGECFESDEIHYKRAGLELKARLAGNRGPTIDPTVTGTLSTRLQRTEDPISALAQTVVVTGYRAGTEVKFDARALDPDGDAVTVAWAFTPSTGTSCGAAPPLDCSVEGPTATFRWDAPGTYFVSAVATDAHGATATWGRFITVMQASSGTPPVAADDSLTTREDTAIDFSVVGNDADVDNDIDLASMTLADNPTNGTWEDLGNGRIRFTPAPDFSGDATAGYEICDVTDLCDDAAIVLRVLPANDPPDAVDDTGSTSREVAVTIRPWLNDSDDEGGLVQGSVARACATEPSGCAAEDADLHGSWSIAAGRVTYTPAAGFTGEARYRYAICDIDGACGSATIRVTVIDNHRPVAAPDVVSMLEDGGPFTFSVLQNDSDPDGQIVPGSLAPFSCGDLFADPSWLTCVNTLAPVLLGDWSLNSSAGTFTYTPFPDNAHSSLHPARARYVICDDDGACSEGEARVEVRAVNDAPSFTKGLDQTVDEDAGAQDVAWASSMRPGPIFRLPPGPPGPLPPGFSLGGDESEQRLDFLVETDDPSLFAVQPTIDAGGRLRYTPAPNAHGSTTVTVRLHDEGGTANGGVDTSAPQTFTITINPVNDPPVAVDDTATTDEDTPTSVDVLANDDEVDGEALSITTVSDPANGSASMTAGQIRYEPDADRSGSDSFTYTVCDTTEQCSTATVNVTVEEVNDAPAIAGDSSTGTVQYSDGIGSVKYTASDRDHEAGDLALTASSLPTGLAFTDNGDGTGTLSGTAGVKQGSYEITVTATDPGGLTASATFTLVVVPENASIAFRATDPAAVKVAKARGNSGPVTLTLLVSETEPDAPSGSAAAGNINRAVTTVELVPVGPGTPIAGSCTAATVAPVTGYADELTVKCSFSKLPVHTYTVRPKVGGGWYVGAAESVFTVFDPSLGCTTGGGWFYWPGTTDRTTFGYTLNYKSKPTSLKGSLIVIRHLKNGSTYKLKSSALGALSMGEDRSIPMGWAAFTGKATYLEPGWRDPRGNHSFTAYVEDRNKPGTGVDRFWLRVDNGITPVTLSMSGPATTNAVTLRGGNIVVPHKPQRR